MAKYEKSRKVYSCCGQYFACTNATSNDKLYCPRCGCLMDKPIKLPVINIVKQV